MKIILSRKGFDDKHGGMASVIWPETKEMLSLPIPVESSGEGISADEMYFKGKKLANILDDLGYNKTKQGSKFHFDPMIQGLTGKLTFGAFGQIGAARSHLNKKKIGKGDIFLFFGTFCKTRFEKDDKLSYTPMHPFHSIWGYLKVDEVIEDVRMISDDYLPELRKHPHFINKDKEQYKKGNSIYVGKDFGNIKYCDILRLTKQNHIKSYWSLPAEFIELSISYCDDNIPKEPASNGRVEFMSAPIGQEFVIEGNTNKLSTWLQSVFNCKNHQ